MWKLGTVRKGDPKDTSKPLTLRDYHNPGSHPTEPGGWHLTYTLFGPALYLKYVSTAAVGVTRVAQYPHINNVHKHLAMQRNASVVIVGRDVSALLALLVLFPSLSLWLCLLLVVAF